MIKRIKKKGFTIVELVIVIAVVAVLAAVLIPTFSSIVEKSNESADKQAVYQMNIIIAAEAITNEKLIDENGVLDPIELKNVLEANGFDTTNFSPTTPGLKYMWDKANQIVILVKSDGDNKIQVYPEVSGNATVDASNVIEIGSAQGGNEGGEGGGNGGNTTVHVTGVSLEPTTATLNIGGTVTLDATVAPTNATNQNVTWSTSAPTVATVENGLVTAKAEGVAVIIVATEDGGKMATCTVTVNGSGEGNEQLPDDPDKGVGTAADLKTALEAGGEYYLTADIELATAVNIRADITSKLHLNDHKLTLKDPSGAASDVISVSGSLTITNGNVVVESVVGNQGSYSDKRGIYVSSGGTLELKNVHVDGNRPWNIENKGTAVLTNAQITVNKGFGLANSGTATITGGSFVANGTGTTQIYNVGGTMRITKTAFSEENDFESYYSSSAPIFADGGEITLNGVTVTTKTNAPSVYAGYNSPAQITVESGSFNSKFGCLSGSSVTVKGGTFRDKTFAELYAESDDAVKEALCSYTGWTVTRADNVITLTRN